MLAGRAVPILVGDLQLVHHVVGLLVLGTEVSTLVTAAKEVEAHFQDSLAVVARSLVVCCLLVHLVLTGSPDIVYSILSPTILLASALFSSKICGLSLYNFQILVF